MAEQLLGTDFEIHGGGSDLVFPHHENEIAQTEAARGEPLARIWMHNGMLQLGDGGEKMAKSVGNIHLLHAALDEYGRDALIAYFTSGHYRQPIGYSGDALAEAQRSVDRLRELGRRLDRDAPAPEGQDAYAERFFDHLADDFNTPAARAVLFEWVGEANRRLDAGDTRGGRRARGHAARAGPGEPARGRRRRGPRRRGAAPAGRARAGAGRARLRPRRRASRPAGRRGLGGARHPRGRAARARLILYGRNPVREALRGSRRGVQRVWATEAAQKSEDWLAAAAELHTADAAWIEERAGSADHQGICAEADGYPYADPGRLLADEQALVLALDEVQDPHNLGAVCRVAESVGAAGVVIPERRAAEVTAAAAKASAGAVEHLPVARVRNLADWLGQAKARAPGSTAPRPGRRPSLRPAGLPRPGRAGPGLGGKGPPAARGGGVRPAGCAAPARAGRIAEREHRRGRPDVRDLAFPQVAA